jgi:hypothetical protein
MLIFQLLTVSREKAERVEDGFQTLLTVTHRRKADKAHEWLLDYTKRWSVSSTLRFSYL